MSVTRIEQQYTTKFISTLLPNSAALALGPITELTKNEWGKGGLAILMESWELVTIRHQVLDIDGNGK